MPPEPSTETGSGIAVVLFAKLDPRAFALGVGAATAATILVATLALIFKGAPAGQEVGSNLSVIARYFPGFEVSVLGSLGGAVWGFLGGGLFGFFVALMWNLTHLLVAGFAALRNEWFD